MAYTPIPRPPRESLDGKRDPFELTKWFDVLWRALGVGGINWRVLDFTNSQLSDIETRPHSDLQDVLQADDTSSSTDAEKHVTDALVKKYEDHRTASSDVHGIGASAAVVGTNTTQVITNKKFGSSTNYTEFEADGSMRAVGNATTFEDLQGSVLNLQRQGTGVSLNATENSVDFTTSANLNDYIYDNFQVPHAWSVGSDLMIHCHWWQAEGNLPNFLVRYRWQVQGEAKTTTWTDIPFTVSAFTYSSGTLNQISYGAVIPAPVGAGLSDVLDIRFFRDTANTSGEFTGTDPYSATVALKFLDIHVERDTMGSRTEYTK